MGKGFRMSWNGFYGDFYSELNLNSQPQQIYTLLSNMIAENPSNELHVEFAAVALCAMKAYGYKAYNDQVSALVFDHLKSNYTSINWRLMGKIVKSSMLNDGPTNIDDQLLQIIQQKPTGFLVDIDGVYSSQYHSYILLLLALFGKGDEIKSVVEKGLAWCESQFQRIGDTNATGRGRFQKFGYASVIVAHFAASDKWGIGVSELFVQATMNKLYNAQYNSSALSIFWESPIRNKLLHKYNTKNDYNGFSEFWLRFVKEVLNIELNTTPITCNNKINVYHFDDMLLFFDDESQIACIDFAQDSHVSFATTLKSKVFNTLKFKEKILCDDLIRYDAYKPFGLKDKNAEINYNKLADGFSLDIKSSLYAEYNVWYNPDKVADISFDIDGSVDKFNHTVELYKSTWHGYTLRCVRKCSSFIKISL